MSESLQYIFLLSVLLIVHTYFMYPLFMALFFSKEKKSVSQFSENDDELPQIAVLVAAYNEENVIREKIESVYNTSYPAARIRVLVGSDASIDKTDSIVQELKKKYPTLSLIQFSGRVGKIGIINHLYSLCEEEILILTDANVIFRPATLIQLVKKFKDEKVGIVAANIIKVSGTNDGISYQEKKYLSLENKIKTCESNGFQMVMGAEGGCYAIRNRFFTKIPQNFIVDDFFITMHVILRGNYVLFNKDAVCIEDVASDAYGEYRRKVRISSGNFQNLYFFRRQLVRVWTPLSFLFLSHKVLRWLTPFFLLTALFSSGWLSASSQFFAVLFFIQLFGLLMPLFNYLLKFKMHFLKFISHFYLMNFALFEGFINYSRGIKSSVWQPVKRNV